MREDLTEILNRAQQLHRLLTMTPDQRVALERSRVQQGDMTTIHNDMLAALETILERSEELVSFLDRFESSPIIYTGEGSTQEVLTKLHRLIAIARQAGEEV